MKSAKALGLKKGDFIITEAGFPAILIGDVHTGTPLAEVWGFEQEMGGVYAEEVRGVTFLMFLQVCERFSHNPVTAHSPVSKDAIKAAMVAAGQNAASGQRVVYLAG